MKRGLLLVAACCAVTVGLAVGVYVTGGAAGDTGGFEFREVADDVGLDYEYVGSGISNTNAGTYVADYDRDGWGDLLLIGGREPVLYENRGGSFVASGDLPDLPGVARVHSALFFDYDRDGWEDLLLLTDPGVPRGDYTPATGDSERNVSHPVLLENDEGQFRVTETLEDVVLRKWVIGATTADYDRDGCLDVFVYQDGDWADRTPAGYHDESSIGNVTDDNGESNYLLAGDCAGGFENVTAEAGVEGERWSLAASFVDLTGDGWPDVHVANDYNEDILYVNEGDGTFEQVRMGDDTDRNGMSSEVADVNRDGRPDVFVTNIANPMVDQGDLSKDTDDVFVRKGMAENARHRGNTLMLNLGNGSFVDRAPEYGVRRAPTLWGWAAVMDDLDNDGDLDLVHTNNEVSSITSNGGRAVLLRTDTPPAIWEGAGDHFAQVDADAVGLAEMNGRGMVRMDYDRDGDLDLVVADDDDSVKLYENRVDGGESLQVRVLDEHGAPAVGATVRATVDGTTHHRVQNAKVDFLSQGSRVLHVGLGDRESVATLRVRWPDGTERVFEDVAAGGRVVLHPDGRVEWTGFGSTPGPAAIDTAGRPEVGA